MSYCRWSDLDFGCDLYCYQSEEGYVTHVASTRYVGEVPHVPADWFRRDDADWAAIHRARGEFLATCGTREIGLPHDGVSFTDPDIGTYVARLTALRDMGYHLPGHVIPGLEDMAAVDRDLRAHLG